jgi:hypothetical protein
MMDRSGRSRVSSSIKEPPGTVKETDDLFRSKLIPVGGADVITVAVRLKALKLRVYLAKLSSYR